MIMFLKDNLKSLAWSLEDIYLIPYLIPSDIFPLFFHFIM